jgi:hypothetical protein
MLFGGPSGHSGMLSRLRKKSLAAWLRRWALIARYFFSSGVATKR